MTEETQNIILVDDYDDICFKTLILFFNKHDFPVIGDRLLINYLGQMESFPLIRQVWFDLLEGSPSNIIDWYEKGWDKERSIRYENIIINFFVNLLNELLVAIMAGLILKNKDELINHIKKVKEESVDKYDSSIISIKIKYRKYIIYLLKMYILKNYALNGMKDDFSARYDEFIKIREKIKSVILLDVEVELPKSYVEYEIEFIKKHNLPYFNDEFMDEITNDLVELIISDEINDIRTTLLQNKNEVKIKKGQETILMSEIPKNVKPILVLNGLGASFGTAWGKCKIIHGLEDLTKIKRGDIFVSRGVTPDMAQEIILSNAVITDYGGGTSHAAVVCRGLKIPAVVGTQNGTEVLEDDLFVIVDGSKGEVYSFYIE